MATTLATFYNTYANLSLAGVTNLSYPPTAVDLNSGRMPCKWVDSLGVSESPLHSGGPGGERVLSCRLVVLVARNDMDSHDRRWAETLAMVDTVNAGIKTVADALTTWSVAAEPGLYDGYFGVVAQIETSEIGR